MDFLSSQTIINLGRAFAGESQAKNRYELYAEQARLDGYMYMSSILQEIAGNEYAHAQRFFNLIRQHAAEPVKNIQIDAGYPFEIASTTQNMLFASQGETMEADNIYPAFAKTAKDEGFADAEALFTMIGAVERRHSSMFAQLHQRLTTGTVYQADSPVEWQCSFCGHRHTMAKAWEKCPLCGKPQGWVVIDLQK